MTEVKTAAEYADLIGVPLDEWAGACHGISSAIAPLVGGVVRRGYFIGDTKPGAYFHGSFSQHSWVELPDGQVLDPTRFAFVGGEPEAWVGPDDDYDIGGCRSAAPSGSPPVVSGDDVVLSMLSVDYVSDLLGGWADVEREGDDGGGVVFLAMEQALWLANLPVKEREAPGVLARWFAAEVYEALVNAGQRALIPIDRLEWIAPDLAKAG